MPGFDPPVSLVGTRLAGRGHGEVKEVTPDSRTLKVILGPEHPQAAVTCVNLA